MIRRLRSCALLCAFLCASLLLACGCTPPPPNPSFPLSTDDAHRALTEMRKDPRPAARPIVVIGGFGDPGIGSSNIKTKLEPCLDHAQFIRVDPWAASDFDAARKMVVEAVQERFPSSDPHFTVEVDVVGNSMGGLVALCAVDPAAASESASLRTLKAARVFTIAAPLRGANAAEIPTVNALANSMRCNSPLLQRLANSGYTTHCVLVPYTRADDAFVGADSTAPPGVAPWWVPAEFFQSGHMTAHDDPRILADIARQLRNEAAYTREPRTPLPTPAN